MIKEIRPSTLQTLGLGSVLELFKNGRLPVKAEDAVDRVFGEPGSRGALVISGANGIVGAGKTMQLGSRLQPFGVPMVALDFPNAPDGLGQQYPGLRASFGPKRAADIMANIVRLSYDGRHLPRELEALRPRFLLEAIPEILDIKKEHYRVFRKSYPDIEIRSVTSGFPSSELGVGIAHPAFPHQINKIWEVVEAEPSDITKMLWALGMVPMTVSDHWSFVLDVLFCGLTHAGLRFHRATNMPFWKADKFIRRLVGPNPFRAHDAIGAAGANFLTWSCLHHLGQQYGDLFRPTPELEERKDSGQTWYPPNHFRPLINWSLGGQEEEEFEDWILGPLFQMAALMVKEERSHLSHINAIGELCAQFRSGILALARRHGPESVVRRVEGYHKLHPESADSPWYPEVFEKMEEPAWQQLYVNAEHDGEVGVLSINRESYNADVDREMNRAIDWLKTEGIGRVIVTGDFHLSTQLVGADTNEFFPALSSEDAGFEISSSWSRTARRLNDEFEISVGFVNGKRCLGGCLELMVHCHYLIAVQGADLGLPEVTLPVVPGMEGCHWTFRKCAESDWSKVLHMALTGRSVKADEAVGWLIDHAAPMEDALQVAWKIATQVDSGVPRRSLETGPLTGSLSAPTDLPEPESPETVAGRKAILDCIQASCGVPLAEALEVQARHSAGFMTAEACRRGFVGAEYSKTMKI